MRSANRPGHWPPRRARIGDRDHGRFGGSEAGRAGRQDLGTAGGGLHVFRFRGGPGPHADGYHAGTSGPRADGSRSGRDRRKLRARHRGLRRDLPTAANCDRSADLGQAQRRHSGIGERRPRVEDGAGRVRQLRPGPGGSRGKLPGRLLRHAPQFIRALRDAIRG